MRDRVSVLKWQQVKSDKEIQLKEEIRRLGRKDAEARKLEKTEGRILKRL